MVQPDESQYPHSMARGKEATLKSNHKKVSQNLVGW